MDRKEFLKNLGVGAAFVLTSSCLGGCSIDQELSPVDLKIDLTDPEFASLTQNEGYIVIDRVVVARDVNGDFVAATQLCSHEDKFKIIYKNDEWFCTDHDARFSLSGDGLNEKGSKGITTYETLLNGNILSVFS